MTQKLGILLIRGSGSPGFNRQERFLNRLFKKLEKAGINTNQISYEFVDWYEHLDSKQEIILERMYTAKTKLRARATRKLLITNISDLINYGGKPNLPSQPYEETHKLVYKSIKKLKDKLSDDTPLIVIASSMGTEIINNYIWDRQHASGSDSFGGSPFERFETMVGLFTFGSNLPIFASSHNIDFLQPIAFPSPNLNPNLAPKAIWENFYDKNDSLGYPIKPLNQNYENSVVKDIQVNVGMLFTFWNLLSHFGYWTSRKINKRIANYIKGIYTVL